MTFWQVVVTGCIAPGVDDRHAVPRWLREARQLVALRRVTGGLLFDGERWVQLFEGERSAVEDVVRALATHQAMGAARVLAEASAPSARCRDWLAAYVEAGMLAALQDRFIEDSVAAVGELVSTMMAADPS